MFLLVGPPQASAAVAPERLAPEVEVGACPPADERAGRWVFLSDLPWSAAATGWQAIADVVLPERDVSFSRNPLVIGGTSYEKGLSTYPLSEITYDLGGRYAALRAELGLNDDSAAGGAAVYLVYADGALVYNSGPIRAGEGARALDLCLAGVRELRLVTAPAGQTTIEIPGAISEQMEAGQAPQAVGAFANWAAARVFLPAGSAVPPSPAAIADRAGARRAQQVGELGAHGQVGAAWHAALATRFGVPATLAATEQWPAQTQAFRDDAGRLALAHRRLAVQLGFGGGEHAALSVLDARSGALIFSVAGSAIASPGGMLDLARDTVPAAPDAFSFSRIDDPALGPGAELRARLKPRAAPDGSAELIELRLALFDDRPYFTYQIVLEGWGTAPRRLDYLSARGGSYVTGPGGRYFADASYARHGALADDGLWRSARLGIGKPAVIWADGRPGSTVFAMLDEQRLPAWLVAHRDPGRAAAAVGVSQPVHAALDGTPAETPGDLAGPRLLVEQSAAADLPGALATYRRVISTLYPPAPVADWVRYQWGSWYAYGDRVDEARVRRQIDLIADYLSDLGPWHVVIDAGWQDIGLEGSGDLGRANPGKFPSGLRALVDYAHSRGVRVMLYLSPTYVHDGAVQGEWLGLHGLLRTHPEWFVRVSPQGAAPGRFIFDVSHPEARAYLAEAVGRFVTEHDADGISLDGLGDIEGQLVPMAERTAFLPDRWKLTPVMDVYRLVAESLWARKPNAHIESGWVSPAAAHPYAHTFRFADDWNAFDYGYPNGGLLQHFDYAVVQRALGQRGQVGASYGGFNRPLADQWIGMAMATGGHISLGSDLTFVRAEGYAALRAQLVHYRPFAGETRTGTECQGLCPSWAATHVGDLTFVGLMNREREGRRVEVRLADLPGGAAASSGAVAYDVAAGRLARVGETLAAEVPAQTFRLFVVRRTPGVYWTTSSYETESLGTGWRLSVRGPAAVEGHVRFYLPGGAPREVRLDGRTISVPRPGQWEGASYDAASQVLSVQYVHDPTGRAAALPRGAAAMPARTIEILR
ncbi:MAG TPA: NPCBM/NEW2 domain-containing protein [Chloroflexota bacterium]|nr:NPCBM/NEW2 domain-containing protein [Chloroflexota bacterium]